MRRINSFKHFLVILKIRCNHQLIINTQCLHETISVNDLYLVANT